MAELSLAAEPRVDHGTSYARRLRVAGRIPAVVYGHGIDPKPISVEARELRHAFATEAGLNVLLNLDIAGERHLAVARELQRHPVRQTVTHIDFQVVRADELITAEVSLSFVGEPLTITRAGGNVEHLINSVHVRAKATDVPSSIELDVSALDFDEPIRLSALVVPDGVTIEGDPETTLVVGHPPRTQSAEGVEDGAEASADGASSEESADS